MKTMEMTKATKKNLPAGWRWVKLGEVCRVFAGSAAPQGKDYFSSVGPFFFRVSDIGRFRRTMQLSESQDRLSPVALARCQLVLARKGAVLFPKSGAAITTNNRALLDVDGYIVSHLMALEPTDAILAEWVYHATCRIDMMDFSDNTGYPSLKQSVVEKIQIPLPPLAEQWRIAGVLREQMAAVEKARAAAQARLEAVKDLPAALVRETLRNGRKSRHLLGECLLEVRNGVGVNWSKYPVLGATRDGLAPAKEPVGKTPERYKLADPVTVFYNPMRILLGSIAMVDEGDEPGITSPDYVVVKGRSGVLDTRWFNYWFRSTEGVHLIDSLSRGAVRERILFNRLAAGEIEIPDYKTQLHASSRMEQVKPIIETITLELNTINALPAALLRRAFAGDL